MVTRYTLENGFTVVFDEQHAAQVAAFQVWVKAGSADERPDQAGLAHLHEHMLFKGTARRGPGEVAREIEANGGEINAWTSFDQTVYHVVIASPFARAGLDVLGDAVRQPAFDAVELAREIEVVREEIKRSHDAVGRRASRLLYETMFRVHPYGRPVIGTDESVRGFGRDQVLEFYRRHYTPGNMVLSAVGDLDGAALRGWVEEIFGGDWGRPTGARVVRAAEPPLEGRRIQLQADSTKELHLAVAFHCASGSHPDTPALDALSMLLGQGDASRLSLEVKRRRSLVNAIGAYAYTPVDPGVLSASFSSAPASAAAALEETLRVLMELTRSPVPREELATVQAMMEADAVYARETMQGIARKLGFYQASGGGLEEEARYYDAVARLTPEALQAVAAKYMRLDRLAVTALLPGGEGPAAGEVERILDRVSKETAGARVVPRAAAPVEPAPIRLTPKARGDSPVLSETLPSGATVLVRAEAAAPLVAFRAAFLGGARFEDDATTGLSALLARTLVRGTAHRSAEELSLSVQQMAGSLGATTGRNSVNVRGEFLSKHFRHAFDTFADVLNQPAFPEAELERERRLVLQELLSRDDRPANVVYDEFARTMFQRHPYRLRLIGEPRSVEQLTVEQLRRYHAEHLDTSQLVLAVVGDVDPDEVFALAHQAFGRPRGAAAPPPAVEPEPPAERREARRVLPTAQTHVVLGFRGLTVTDPARYAVDVLSTVLSGQGGRLFVELRDKRSMAYSVSSASVEGLDPGYFGVYIATSPEKADAAIEGIRAELARIRDERVSDAELDRAIRLLIGSHAIGLQRNGARAGVLAVDHLFGIGLEKFLHYPQKVREVTADEVLALARRLLDFDRMVIARVGPDGAPR